MFAHFLLHLRARGLKVSLTEWLALVQAMAQGHARVSVSVFYHLARAVLVKNEAHYDIYDQAFAEYFEGLEAHFELSEEVLKWLENPVLPRELTDEERAMLQAMNLDKLRAEFEQRLREQKERHDGGNRFVGTGGTSPFGAGGENPQGMRVGDQNGGRSAVRMAEERRFQNLRSDRVLDTRQLKGALRRLRRLAKDGREEELDLDLTVDKSAKGGGEIDLVFGPPRKNRIKLCLLVDVGGSMDPHADLCERLFSAAHASNHFKAFRHYFFHNCPYSRVYSDMMRFEGTPTARVLKELDSTWSVIFVGDAWMSPYELTYPIGSSFYGGNPGDSGLTWLDRFRKRCPNSVWLNPEPPSVWQSESVQLVRRVFPMFRLSLDGLTQALDMLRGKKPNVPDLRVTARKVPA